MEIIQAMKNRHSVRQYTDKPIDPQVLQALQAEIDFCNKHNYKYFECSALTGYNIHEMFSYITRDIIERDFNCNTKNK